VSKPTVADQVGRVLEGRYRLVALLGRGAAGQVYLAVDTTLERNVAVKLLHGGLADDQAFLRRFRAEAQAAAMLSHPHIVSVHDWGEDDGEPFLVMEHLSGGSLRGMIDAGRRLEQAQAAAVGAQAARALAYAHRRGLLHRDIKPSNLLFGEDGSLRIADFGLARALAEAAWTEPVGALLGTARYASPEQVEGRTVDGGADVYALGLVLVEAVTGKVPFSADTTIATLMARMGTELVAPPEMGPLAPLVEAATRSDPSQRLDAATLASKLEETVRGLPPPSPLLLEQPPEQPSPVGPTPAPIASFPLSTRTPIRSLVGKDDKDESEPVAPASTIEPEAVFAGLSGARAPDPDLFDIEEVEAARGGRRSATIKPLGARRRRWPWVIAVIVVLLALGGSALGAWYYDWGVPGFARIQKYAVPSLVGKTLVAARAELSQEKGGLGLAATRVYEPHIAPGVVATQSPAARVEVRTGRVIKVEVSKGPPPRAIPSLAGLPRAAATLALFKHGFEYKVSATYSETSAAGVVISWSPRGVASYRTMVAVLVSLGPRPRLIPHLARLSFSEADSILAALRLGASEHGQYDDAVPLGEVIASVPPPGELVHRGSVVEVIVSLGPPFVIVPPVVGKKAAVAAATLEARGLVVGGIYGPDHSGTVVYTKPAAGQRVRQGSAVIIDTN
jgi:eukaryotic-like serine/threonine-protein kinase